MTKTCPHCRATVLSTSQPERVVILNRSQSDRLLSECGYEPKAATPAVGGEITDAMVNAAAREMWNDRDARHGGSWDERDPREVCVIQTKATAKAALKAARAATPADYEHGHADGIEWATVHGTAAPAVGGEARKWIIDLIHNEYDPKPSDYRPGDNWNDGAEEIADQILERLRNV